MDQNNEGKSLARQDVESRAFELAVPSVVMVSMRVPAPVLRTMSEAEGGQTAITAD